VPQSATDSGDENAIKPSTEKKTKGIEEKKGKDRAGGGGKTSQLTKTGLFSKKEESSASGGRNYQGIGKKNGF